MKIPAKYTDFILLYNETFKYIEKEFSREEVNKYWAYMSKKFLKELRDIVKEKGFLGLMEYWYKSLENEDIDTVMQYDFKSSVFSSKVFSCSAIKVLKSNNVEIWHDYCEHCVAMYVPALRDSGFNYDKKYEKENGIPTGRCSSVITKIDK